MRIIVALLTLLFASAVHLAYAHASDMTYLAPDGECNAVMYDDGDSVYHLTAYDDAMCHYSAVNPHNVTVTDHGINMSAPVETDCALAIDDTDIVYTLVAFERGQCIYVD